MLTFDIERTLLILGIVCLTTAHACESRADETTTALWLARSCVGEAGWDSHTTGECAAIMHIYRKRSQINGWTVERTARKYSAAIRPWKGNTRRWLRHMDATGAKPHKWPRKLRWEVYLPMWLEVYAHAVEFLEGTVPDPLPTALHYGGRMDHWRAQREGWVRLRTMFRNLFYRVPGVSLVDPADTAATAGQVE
jgi:hypothetical protein